MARFIGVAHRVKVIVQKDKPPVLRPTKFAIREDGAVTEYALATETDELDWLRGQFPVKYRSVKPEDDISAFPARQVVWRKAKTDENLEGVPESHIRQVEGRTEVASKVPSKFDGLKSGDRIALVLSGSGNRLAYAASRNAEMKGADAFHLPGFKLHGLRPNADDSDSDHLFLAEELEKNKPGMFYAIEPRDRDLVAMRELLNVWEDAMKARMAAEQRVRAHLMGQIFCNPTGGYPEGDIELVYEAAVANDAICKALAKEENKRRRELGNALDSLEVYRELFAPVEGLGPAIASRLISAIDIRQFATAAKLKAYCGVHVLPDGRFPRRRNGELANWKPDCRQALFLLGDQFNRRPGSEWGMKLREYKVKFRANHPVVICKACNKPADQCDQIGKGDHKRAYTNAHIHKMAVWRTLTKFVERLHRDWTRLEKAHNAPPEYGIVVNQ